MRFSKMVAAAGGFMALLVSAGAGRATAAEACLLGSDNLRVTSVAEFRRPTETGGYGGTVNRLLRGAEIRVTARPGLTAEWVQRELEAQKAAGVCYFGAADASVDVVADSDDLIIRITSSYDGPGVTRLTDRKPQEVAARDIVSQAQTLLR
jgi:hypothetical protein